MVGTRAPFSAGSAKWRRKRWRQPRRACRSSRGHGTREARRSTCGEEVVARSWSALEPSFQFSMSGIGYFHPEWGHGSYTGEDRTGYDVYEPGTVDETSPLHMHVQAFCRATLREGGRSVEGRGSSGAADPRAPRALRLSRAARRSTLSRDARARRAHRRLPRSPLSASDRRRRRDDRAHFRRCLARDLPTDGTLAEKRRASAAASDPAARSRVELDRDRPRDGVPRVFGVPRHQRPSPAAAASSRPILAGSIGRSS